MTALYIHIPFCKKKCNYCDFVSYAGKEGLMDAYVEALIRELKTSPLSSPSANSFPSPSSMERGGTNKVSDGVRPIFIGGGTPTLLEASHFDQILTPLIPLSIYDGEGETRSEAEGGGEVPEISLESNPGTADRAKLKALRELGINRLSIGVQSFNDQHLKRLGRIHDSKDVFRFYADARSAGFENINLDLIFALPGQTLKEWKNDLETALSLKPNHLSAYNLQIEEGTPFWEMIWKPATKRRGFHNREETAKFIRRFPSLLELPSEEVELSMYEHTIDALTAAGYNHYEVSNFARPGFECKHNINYWKNGDYIGVGAGAHSHVNGKRRANPDSIEEYLNTPSSFLPLNKGENVERSETRRGETIFLGLRMLEGLPIGKFKGFEKEVGELIKNGLLTQENGNYKLTRQGLYLGNLVFEKFV